MNDALGAEIVRMANEDQRARRELMAVDRANALRLKEIVAAIGWPTRSKVGDAAEHQAWLLLQHADLSFQEECLALMKAAATDEVCPQHIAYLEDRVAIRHGLRQRYGTQLRPTLDGLLEACPIEDPDGVDARRRTVGLDPVADYVARANAHRAV